MKVLYIHNEYAKPSGEENAAGELVGMLREHGHEVRWFTRSSAELAGTCCGPLKALFTGVWNPSSARALERVLDEYRPDIVQVQNLYPLLSTSIFGPLRRRGIPVVMRCPNYRLFCPTGLCLDRRGQVCERCWRGWLREWHCVTGNCEVSVGKSIGYAARGAFARLTRGILDGVDMFIVQSDFQRRKFIGQGIADERIGIVPGIVPAIADSASVVDDPQLVTFVGRVSREKGIEEFIEAARLCPDAPFRVAGNIDINYYPPRVLPRNLEFVGFVKGEALNDLYRQSRIIVVPSKWYEGFPNVIVRGMLLRRPVVTTAIGAMQSIIDDRVNGRLVPPGDAKALAAAIDELWHNPALCDEYGRRGREKADREYSREQIYHSLMDVYARALAAKGK